MLKLQKLELSNWCQHRDLKVTFDPYLTGIIGANGRGKSNLLNAIFTALTGKSQNGNIQDNITVGCDKSTITLTFLYGQDSGTITRSFTTTSSTASLKFKDTKLTGVTKVTDFILNELLNIPVNVITDHVYISQDQLTQLLYQTYTNRISSLTRLVPEVTKINKLRDALQNELNTVLEPTPSGIEANLRKQISEYEESIKNLKVLAAEAVNKIPQLKAQEEALLKEIQSYQKALELQRKIDKLQQDIERYNINVSLYKQEYEQLKAKIESQPAVEELNNQLKEIDNAYVVLTATQLQLQQLIPILKQETGTCPVCGSTFTNRLDRLNEAQTKLNQVIKDLNDLTVAKAKLTQTKQQLINVDLTKKQKQIEDAISSLGILNGQLLALTDELKKLDTNVASLNTLNNQLTIIRNQLNEYTGVNERLNQVTIDYNNTVNLLTAVQEETKKADQVRSYRALLNEVKDVFHPTKAPRELLIQYSAMLQTTCNDYLTMFQSPFVVKIDNDFNFMCELANGYTIDFSRLSGGQRSILSVAMRFAINDIFARNVGFMVMDEPTAALDADNVKLLGDLIEKVSQISQKTHMQTIVVTHAKELMSSFNKVIQL